MKTKDEVIDGFMERHCAMSSKKGYNTIRSQLGGIWRNGYETGLEDGRNVISNKPVLDELFEIAADKKKEIEDEAYQRGLADAWEAAWKIVSTGGLDYRELIEIFGTDDMIIEEFTVQEAIRRIKAYEEKEAKKEKLKVGDEVRGFNGETYVIYDIKGDSARATNFTICSNCFNVNDTGYKTGRHFPQVEQLLKEMRENT